MWRPLISPLSVKNVTTTVGDLHASISQIHRSRLNRFTKMREEEVKRVRWVINSNAYNWIGTFRQPFVKVGTSSCCMISWKMEIQRKAHIPQISDCILHVWKWVQLSRVRLEQHLVRIHVALPASKSRIYFFPAALPTLCWRRSSYPSTSLQQHFKKIPTSNNKITWKDQLVTNKLAKEKILFNTF